MPYLDIPTTYAPYKPGDVCPWSMIEHTCPSNIAWIVGLDNKYHIFRRAWQQDDGKESTDEIRSDGLVWNRFKRYAFCGRPIWLPYFEMFGARIVVRKLVACAECWEKRW